MLMILRPHEYHSLTQKAWNIVSLNTDEKLMSNGLNICKWKENISLPRHK